MSNDSFLNTMFARDKMHKNRFRRYCRTIRFTRNTELGRAERILKRILRVWDKVVVGTIVSVYVGGGVAIGFLWVMLCCVIAALPIAIAVLFVCLILRWFGII